jgi:hypothetical protein
MLPLSDFADTNSLKIEVIKAETGAQGPTTASVYLEAKYGRFRAGKLLIQ